MLSPTINEIILRLFDNASQGITVLSHLLKTLFQCEQLMITTDAGSDTAANDICYQADDAFLCTHQESNSNCSEFQVLEYNTDQCILKLCPEENLYLKLQFKNHDQLQQCINSTDISVLIPHIKQAILIANQISQQQGDIYSLNYVMTNHPCRQFIQALNNQATVHINPEDKKAANTAIDLELDRELLIKLFSFTSSETELVKLLFLGLNLQEIAEYRSVSKQTVKKQLQSIFKKTFCDSQEALILIIFDALSTGLKSPEKSAKSNKACFENSMD